ncbi:MAG: PKD domain-containing protein [Anaerolineae bacterium]|nr:PKD domain-containing protein [Anaerolineae bacterium]
MRINDLFNQFQQSSWTTKLIIGLFGLIWTIVLVTLLGLGILFFASPSQALQPTPGGSGPSLVLDPATGSAGSSVTVRGEGWQPGSMVLLYLAAASGNTPDYALASAIVDATGRFTAPLIIPADGLWRSSGTATVLARSDDSGLSAQTTLTLSGEVGSLPSATPTAAVNPTATTSPTPSATPQPGAPLAFVVADLNVRGGPGTNYPVLGLLKAGQTAEITGRSADGGWWQIRFSGVAGERGWLSAPYVTAQNADNVPTVQAPPVPTPAPATATPTATAAPPTPTPVVITDWRGEYYSNPNLSGSPALVRNDVAVNFNWGAGTPAGGLPADNFSARWTRSLSFPSGQYRFWLLVDDGVRVWVDNQLILDQWRDSSPTTYTAEARLSEGTHHVRIEYYERSGGAQIDLHWQRLSEQNNQKPQAHAGGPYVVDEGSRVNLDAGKSKDPDGKIVKYEWDFNFDGHSFNTDSTDKNPAPRYNDGPANFTIALRVTDNRGASQIATSRVTVLSLVPHVVAGGPYSSQVGNPITFSGTATDPSPVDQSGLSYRWEFGDGATANGPTVSHSYAGAGSYTARLVVTDKDGAQAAATAVVQISAANQAPVAVISGPTGGLVGQTLDFSGAASRDTDGSLTAYDWNFGDGATASGVNVSHSYGQAGTYEVSLTVTDNGGLTGRSTVTVQVQADNQQPPLAVIEAPATGLVGEVIRFDGRDSSDEDGRIVSHAWDFGDGTSSEGRWVEHTYNTPGTYQIVLTVTDDDGLTAQATQTVLIDEPVQVQLPPNVSLVAPATGLVGETLSFDASGSNDPDGQIVDYTWNFGDGVIQSGLLITATHSYSQPGVYTTTLTLTDDQGLINSTLQSITIN